MPALHCFRLQRGQTESSNCGETPHRHDMAACHKRSQQLAKLARRSVAAPAKKTPPCHIICQITSPFCEQRRSLACFYSHTSHKAALIGEMK